MNRAPADRWSRALFYAGAAFVALFMVRTLGPGWKGHFPATWPDATWPDESYLAVAGKSPFRPSFWFAYRPVLYPAFLWVFGRSAHLVVIAQTAAYAAALLALCATAWRVLRSRAVALLTIVVLVGVALQAKYAMWNVQVLSESLAITIGFAGIAAWWRFAAAPTSARAVWAWVWVIAWMLLRDAHVLPAVVILVPVALVAAWRARSLDEQVRRVLAYGAAAVLATAAYAYVAEAVSNRAMLSFHHVVGVRILPDPELSSWFEDRGMPLDDALRSRTGKSGLDDEFWRSTDPAFDEYREWADGSGRRDLVLSMLLLAPEYRERIADDLPAILAADVEYYDTDHLHDRFPRELPGQLGGPTTPRGLAVWLALAAAALVATAVLTGRTAAGRRWVVVGATALVLPVVEVYTIWVGDPIEMQRHTIGALSRFAVASVVVVAVGVDAIVHALAWRPSREPDADPVPPAAPEAVEPVDVDGVDERAVPAVPTTAAARTVDAVRWLTAFALALVVGVTIIGNHLWAQGNDALFSHSLVRRVIEFGGSYYENGIHPKGPLEEVAHEIAQRVAGFDGGWLVISAMIAVGAAVVAAAAFRTARVTGANRSAGVAVGAVVYLHLTLAEVQYSGLLYSRNIMVVLLAAAWLVALDPWPWTTRRRRIAAAGTVGVLLGLAVQTILPAVFDAAFVGAAALVLLGVHATDRVERRRLRQLLTAGAVVGFLSAPVWYLLRGSFREFWASWWTYASYQSEGIGLSIGEQLARGWDNAYAYYQDRPLVFLMLAAFAVVTVRLWSTLDATARVVHVALAGWFASGWFQLVVGQRYSTHYFVVVAVPTALIGAALAGHACRAYLARTPSPRSAVAWPLLAIVLAVYLSAGTASRLTAAAEVTGGYTTPERTRELGRAARTGADRTVQAVLDLVTEEGDAMLAWSDNQYDFPVFRRTPATRFQQKYFLTGSVYLGRTGDEYVLPHSWEWLAEDIEETDPIVFLEDDPVMPDRFRELVEPRFEPVFTGSTRTVHFERSVADTVLRGDAGEVWSVPAPPGDDQGWDVDGATARYRAGSRGPQDDRIVLSGGACTRVSGRVEAAAGSTPGFVVHVTGAAPEDEMRLVLDGATAQTRTGADAALETVAVPTVDGVAAEFAVVAGARSVALVVDGAVVAATALPEAVSLSLSSLRPEQAITDLRTGAPPPGSGC